MKHATDLRPLLQLRLQCSVAISKTERLYRQEDKDWDAVMNSSTSIAADYKDHAESNAQDSPPVPTSCDLQASQSEAYGQLTLQVRTATVPGSGSPHTACSLKFEIKGTSILASLPDQTLRSIRLLLQYMLACKLTQVDADPQQISWCKSSACRWMAFAP